ncbi:MAG TPA: phosphomethylpyrimidine synthase ThiC, partial [Elusimicrobiales bacterium]|nr:phosphomethylpyrimidine synthase ThiC [Elusimicrobiales bacterium]
MTQLESARKGLATAEMVKAAASEGLPPSVLTREIAAGRAVLPANINHKGLAPAVIGKAFRCKINVNLGASSAGSGLEGELCKLALSVKLGADAVMDLSTAGDLPRIREAIIRRSPLPVGTVPVYEALSRAGKIERLTPALLLEVIEEHASQGVDFMTIHAGLLRRHVPLAARRVTGIVSRGGSILARWMERYGRENPLYERFDDICAIFRKYDVTFSLGDGLRPGSLADACDKAQFAELKTLGALVLRARKLGAQAMVEGPGHVPLDKVAMNMEKGDKWCHGAPFYVLGPLVTDIAAGYDHINAAIGGAVAAWSGASFLCYLTPREHLGLPGPEDVRQGIIASKIAAHAGDIARGLPGARDRDDEMSRARFAFDWEKQFSLALDGETA